MVAWDLFPRVTQFDQDVYANYQFNNCGKVNINNEDKFQNKERVTPQTGETIRVFNVRNATTSYYLVMEAGKKVEVEVVYPSGKIQTWDHSSSGGKDKEIDITYRFKMSENTARLNIAVIYEDGDYLASLYSNLGESFVYLPKSEDAKLEVTYYDHGKQCTKYVKAGTSGQSYLKDCHGGKQDLLYLEGRLVDNEKFNPFFEGFSEVLTTKNMSDSKFTEIYKKIG